MTDCIECGNPASYVVAFKPTCDVCLTNVLDDELGPQPDGRPGSRMVPVGLAPKDTDG